MTRSRATIALAVTVVVACIASMSVIAATSGKTTIEVTWYHPKGTPKYNVLAEITRRFEKQTGVAVKIVWDGSDGTPIVSRWRAGNPPEVTDYAGLFFYPSIPATFRYVKAGQVYNMTKWLNGPLPGYKGSWKNAILPAALPTMTYPKNKQFYSTPGELTPQAIYYNKKLFRNLGIPEPTSFAEVLAAAKRLKAAGIAPIAVTGTYPPYMFMWPAYLLLRDVGYSATNAAFTCKRPFASLPGVYSAFDSLESVSRYLLPGFEGTDYLNAQLAFFQDKAGMILMGSWLIGEMKDKIPAGFEVGTIPFPRTGGRGSQVDVIGDVNTMVVAAKSKNPELGAKFLQFYASKKQDAYRNRVLGNISAYRGQPAPPGFEGIVAALNQGGGFVPGNLGVGGLEKKYQDAIFEPVTRLFFGKTDGAGAVAEIDQGLRQACGN